MCIQWTRVLYYAVITRQSNPPISQFNSPCNEFTSFCSMFVYNISTATMTYVAVKANQMEYKHESYLCRQRERACHED